MGSNNKGKNPPPSKCPYCGCAVDRLPQHIRKCDATPESDEVVGD